MQRRAWWEGLAHKNRRTDARRTVKKYRTTQRWIPRTHTQALLPSCLPHCREMPSYT